MKKYFTESEIAALKIKSGFLQSFEFAGRFDDDEAIWEKIKFFGSLNARGEIDMQALGIAYGIFKHPYYGVFTEGGRTIYFTYIHGVKHLAAFTKIPNGMDVSAAADIINGFEG